MKNNQEELKSLCKMFPHMTYYHDNEKIVYEGLVIMEKSYNDIYLYDQYELRLCIPIDYPKKLPVVYDVHNTIPKEFGHVNSDCSLCLAINCELYDYAERGASLCDFFEEFLMPYLYSASFYKRYGYAPFGERGHGLYGIETAYMERYGVETKYELVKCFEYLVDIRRYRGHHLCFCGSGKKFKYCHGKKILNDKKSIFKVQLQIDALRYLKKYNIHTKKEEW